MPAVLVAFAALGVALLCLLVAYAITVLVTPLIEGVLRQVPLIGGDLAGYARSGAEWFAGQLISWVNASLGIAHRWLGGIAELWTDFVAAVDAYVLQVNAVIDQLVLTKIPELVHLGTALLRSEVATLNQYVAGLPDGIADVFTKPLADFRGIEHGVEQKVDQAVRDVRNVDLPTVLTDAERAAGKLFDTAERDLRDFRDTVHDDLGRVLDRLNAIPIKDLLAMLAAFPALALIVQAIEAEAGLGSAECRAKVKNICATNPAAWADLLAVAGLTFAWPGLRAMVDGARALLREVEPVVQEALSGGN